MELNEREKTIVDLIGKLADAADSETTTQETIDHIMEGLQSKTQETVKLDLEDAKSDTPMPKVKFPEINLEKELNKVREQGEQCHCGHSHHQIPASLLFTRTREVKSPCKAHPTDAGIDFFVPDEKAWDEDFRNMVVEYSRNPVPSCSDEGIEFVNDTLVVHPNAHVAIPSGIKTIIPTGLGMMFVNKSGIATKLKLDHSACLVDSEYRDEIIMCFFNHNVKPVTISPGMKITQGLIVPIIQVKMQEVLNCVYDDIGKASDRGGGFGSSGK